MNASPSEKTDDQWSANAAYTINHAIACTASDLLSPFIGNFTQKYLGRRVEVGCRHEHHTLPPAPSPDTPPATPAADKFETPKPQNTPPKKNGLFTRLADRQEGNEESSPLPNESEGRYQRFTLAAHDNCTPECSHPTVPPPPNHLKHWWIGELAGDFCAVPITIGISYWMPGATNGIRHVAEPVLSRFFHAGSQRAAKQWAQDNGVVDSMIIHDKEQAIYEREMSHIPQAIVWTATSTVLNVSTQRLCGNNAPISHLLAGKLAGSATSAALVVGFRGISPHQANRWDEYTSKHIFEPITHAIHGKTERPRWKDRVDADRSQPIRGI